MGKITGFKEYERKDETYTKVERRLKDYKEFTVPLKKDEIEEQGSRCMDCGIPYLNNPPISSSLSKTVTVCPALFNC